LTECTSVKWNTKDDGTVYIGSSDKEAIKAARKIIEDITREAVVGEIYNGEVRRIEKFGAFVQLFQGKDALVHISQLDNTRVNKVEDVVKIGDKILVKVTNIDNQGRVNASRKELLETDKEKKED